MPLQFMDERDGQQEVVPEQQRPRQSIWDTKEYLEFVKHYSQDEIIPAKVKDSNWGIYGKHLIYTFLEERDLSIVDNFGIILRIDQLITQPPHKITIEEVHELDQSQFYIYLSAKRAIGSNREKMNERTLQNTQIAQSIASQAVTARKPSGGFLSRFRSVF